MRHFLLACCALPCLAGTATAHAILMDSQPAAEATVAPGPTHVALRFNSRIDRARSRLELRPAAKSGDPALPPPARLPPIVPEPAAPDILATSLDFAPGAWVLRWQVLAVDGHITRGEVPFTVRTP